MGLLLGAIMAGCGGGGGSSLPTGDGDTTLPPGATGTGFGTPINLSNNAGTSHLSTAAISGTGETATVLVAWRDEVLGTAQIFLARSTDGGVTFGTPVNLSNSLTGFIPPSARPSIAISGTGATATVLVAWHGQTTNFEIFLASSTDGGATFGAPVNLSNNFGSSDSPAVAVSGTGATATVLVTWAGQPGNAVGEFSDILLRSSTDGGATFGPVVNLSNKTDGGTSVARPSVAIFGTGATSRALVAWQDNSLGNFEIFRARSTNGGATFDIPVRLSDNSGFSGEPSVAISGSGVDATLLVAWSNDVLGRPQIFLSRSTDGGATYGPAVNLSNNSGGDGVEPSVAISGSGATATVLVAFELNADIYLVRSSDGGASFGTAVRLTNNSGFTLSPSVAISGTGATETAVVTWSDDVPGGSDIFLASSK